MLLHAIYFYSTLIYQIYVELTEPRPLGSRPPSNNGIVDAHADRRWDDDALWARLCEASMSRRKRDVRTRSSALSF